MPPDGRSSRVQLVAGVATLLVAAAGAVITYDATPDRPGPPPAPGRGTQQPSESLPSAPETGAWVSSPTDPHRRLLRLDTRSGQPATARVRVDLTAPGQVWRGAGAALTDASVELLAGAPDAVRRLFDPAAADGAGLSWVRLPLTSTDMSPSRWTWGWDGTTASPAPQARAAVAMVKRLEALRPDLQVVASPWTAPKWMKQPAAVRGGALRSDHLDQYAAMLVAQAEALRAAGVPLAAMTLGNEPGYSADYPSMTMTAAQQAALARVVGPALHQHGIQLWAVDHNWADRATYDEVLRQAPGAFDAAAFHCYAGRPAQMAGVGVPPVVSECSGTRGSWRETFAWDVRHLLVDSVAAGSTGLLMWNLAVDPRGGPRDLSSRAGCATCRGLVTVDGARVAAGPEFYVLAHLARAADPGARVLTSRASAGLWVVAFRNPDRTVGVVGFNGTGQDRVVALDVPGEREARARVRAGELLTVRLGGG